MEEEMIAVFREFPLSVQQRELKLLKIILAGHVKKNQKVKMVVNAG